MFTRILVAAMALLATGHVAAGGPPSLPGCDAPPLAPDPVQQRAVILVNPATAWQPRGGEVILRIEAERAMLDAIALRACLRWGTGEITDPASRRPYDIEAQVRVRPYETDTVVNAGVIVPNLKDAPEGLLARLLPAGKLRTDGFDLVPVADLRVIAVGQTGVLADITFPIGITRPWNALVTALVLLAASLVVLHQMAVRRGATGAGLLKLICTSDRTASLSAFQLLVMSMTVAFSAVYVMCLSGNLINLTPGTLVMLGVAGASGVAAALQRPNVSADSAKQLAERAQRSADEAGETARRIADAARAGDADAQTKAARAQDLADAAAREATSMQMAALQSHLRITGPPRWSDLIGPVDGSGGIDMSRVQMLFFTLVTAGFVLLKVLNTYVVPDIPDYYLALIGISNGVYVAARAGTVRRRDDPG